MQTSFRFHSALLSKGSGSEYESLNASVASFILPDNEAPFVVDCEEKGEDPDIETKKHRAVSTTDLETSTTADETVPTAADLEPQISPTRVDFNMTYERNPRRCHKTRTVSDSHCLQKSNPQDNKKNEFRPPQHYLNRNRRRHSDNLLLLKRGGSARLQKLKRIQGVRRRHSHSRPSDINEKEEENLDDSMEEIIGDEPLSLLLSDDDDDDDDGLTSKEKTLRYQSMEEVPILDVDNGDFAVPSIGRSLSEDETICVNNTNRRSESYDLRDGRRPTTTTSDEEEMAAMKPRITKTRGLRRSRSSDLSDNRYPTTTSTSQADEDDMFLPHEDTKPHRLRRTRSQELRTGKYPTATTPPRYEEGGILIQHTGSTKNPTLRRRSRSADLRDGRKTTRTSSRQEEHNISVYPGDLKKPTLRRARSDESGALKGETNRRNRDAKRRTSLVEDTSTKYGSNFEEETLGHTKRRSSRNADVTNHHSPKNTSSRSGRSSSNRSKPKGTDNILSKSDHANIPTEGLCEEATSSKATPTLIRRRSSGSRRMKLQQSIQPSREPPKERSG